MPFRSMTSLLFSSAGSGLGGGCEGGARCAPGAAAPLVLHAPVRPSSHQNYAFIIVPLVTLPTGELKVSAVRFVFCSFFTAADGSQLLRRRQCSCCCSTTCVCRTGVVRDLCHELAPLSSRLIDAFGIPAHVLAAPLAGDWEAYNAADNRGEVLGATWV